MRTPAWTKVLVIKRNYFGIPSVFWLPGSVYSETAQGRNKHDYTINCQSATLANKTKGMYNSLESRANKPLHQEIRLNPLEKF